jgi:hypothetical protein
MEVSTILTIVALICFVLAGCGVPVPRAHLGWLGLAFWCLATLLADGDVKLS